MDTFFTAWLLSGLVITMGAVIYGITTRNMSIHDFDATALIATALLGPIIAVGFAVGQVKDWYNE